MLISAIFGAAQSATEAFNDVLASKGILRMNSTRGLMMLAFHVVAALGLYVLLMPQNKSFSLLSVWFRLLHVTIYGASFLNLFSALEL